MLGVAALGYVATLVPRYLGFFRAQAGLEVLLAIVLNLVLAASLGACVLALILVLRSWSHPGVRALALFLAGAATSWTVILGFANFEVEDRSITAHGYVAEGPGAGVLDVVVLVGALILAIAAFLRFSALFPNRLSAADLEAREWGRPIHRMRVALLGPRPVWLLALAWPIVVIGTTVGGVLLTGGPDETIEIEGIAAVPFLLIWVSFPAAALSFGIQNLIAGYRRADEEDRRRLLWLVAGVVMSAWLVLIPLLAWPLILILGDWWSNVLVVLWALAPGVLVSSVAVAIFYTGGVDPALVLRRSTVLGVLGTVWIAFFAAAEGWLSDWVAATLGLPEFVVSIAVALLAAGAALSFRNLASGLAARMPGGDRRSAHWKARRVPVGSQPGPGGKGDTQSGLD